MLNRAITSFSSSKSLSQLFPKRTTVVVVKPDELLLSSVESNQVVLGSLGVNERQADGNDFARIASGVWQVASPNGFVGR